MKLFLLALSLLSSLALADPFHDAPSQQPLTSAEDGTTRMLALHEALINIESISGNEHAVGLYLATYLRGHNLTVETQVVPPYAGNPVSLPRYNVLAYQGASRKSRVLVTTHMDTVPPFAPYQRGPAGQHDIWGRGSVDAKASMAAQISAVLSLQASAATIPGDVALLFVVGEETTGDGMAAVNGLNMSWEAAVFGEPTELKLAAGHKGILGLRVAARGRAAHSGYPWLGSSANSKLIGALARLDALDLGGSDAYGASTINIGRMCGGVAGNVVAEAAAAEVQIRLAGGTVADAKARVLDALGDQVQVEFLHAYPPVACDTDVPGFDSVTVNYGTDIPNLRGGHRRYLYGPGSILVAHSDHEHLAVRDLVQAVRGYKTLIMAALGRKE